MSDGNRQRPAIDLDDLERQLRAVAQPKAARPLPPEPQAPSSPPPFMVKPVFAAPLPENESFTPSEPDIPVEPVAQPLPPKPAPRAADYDPLAELARIAQSGSDWSTPRGSETPSAPPARSTAAIDALEALLRMDPPQKPPVPSYPAVTPRAPEPAPAADPLERTLLDYADTPQEQPQAPAYPEPQLYAEPVAAAEAEPIYAPEGQLPPHDAGFMAEEPPPRSRGGLKLAAALVSVAALGVGGVFLFRGDGVSVGGGPRTPPVIKASNEPAKVAPQNPGGMEVPNSNQEIFAGSKSPAGPAAPSKVVSSEEQPVDVNQAARPGQPRVILPNGGSAATVPPAPPPPVSTVPRDPKGAATTANTNPPQAAPQPPAGAGVAALGEPKKVRTVLVRPDGTVIDGTEPAKPPAMAAAPSVMPASPVPTQTLPGAAAAPPPGGAPPPAIVLPSAPPAPTQTASAPPSPAPEPQAAPTPAPAGTPLPPRRPVIAAAPATPAPEPQPATAAPARPAPAPAAPAAAAPAVSVGTGDFAVQLAAPPTEQEAKTLASRLAQRYGETLAGQEPEIIRAEVNGKILYRVRITGLDRESANTMCNRIKSAQGSCFVAKN